VLAIISVFLLLFGVYFPEKLFPVMFFIREIGRKLKKFVDWINNEGRTNNK
jgi:hypothetical protein